MKPHFKIVVRNETMYWSEEIQKKAGGAIYRAYLFDANRHVHCCELTPSYELFPLYTTAALDDEEGSVEEEIRCAEDNDVIYIHCRVLDHTPSAKFHDCGEWTADEDETYDELRERVEEQYRCNVAIQFPEGFQHEYDAATT